MPQHAPLLGSYLTKARGINGIGKTTATEELQQLVDMAILSHTGHGRGSKYEMAR